MKVQGDAKVVSDLPRIQLIFLVNTRSTNGMRRIVLPEMIDQFLRDLPLRSGVADTVHDLRQAFLR